MRRDSESKNCNQYSQNHCRRNMGAQHTWDRARKRCVRQHRSVPKAGDGQVGLAAQNLAHATLILEMLTFQAAHFTLSRTKHPVPSRIGGWGGLISEVLSTVLVGCLWDPGCERKAHQDWEVHDFRTSCFWGLNGRGWGREYFGQSGRQDTTARPYFNYCSAFLTLNYIYAVCGNCW